MRACGARSIFGEIVSLRKSCGDELNNRIGTESGLERTENLSGDDCGLYKS